MTDEAFAGGAAAPAEGVPINVDAPVPNSPLGSQIPQKEAPPEPVKSARDAIRNAAEQVKAKEAAKTVEKPAEKPADKPEAKAEPAKPSVERDPTGKFVPKQAQDATQQPAQPVQKPADTSPHREAPSRFSPDAKAAWETAPEPVKAEVHRAIREMEAGIQKHKVDAENYEKVRQYDELARQNGGDLAQSLQKVREFEDVFARDPMQGFQKVADHFGISLHAVATHILNQNPDEARYGQDQTIASLKQELATMKQELTGLKPIVQEYKTSSDERTLAEWAADKPHFEDLRAEVTAYVKQGYDPDSAYHQAVADVEERARKFGFAPANQAASSVAPQPKPLNPAGQKSISGAPANGSDPSSRPKGPVPSIKDSLRRAAARAS